jgi:hypothetical protein
MMKTVPQACTVREMLPNHFAATLTSAIQQMANFWEQNIAD